MASHGHRRSTGTVNYRNCLTKKMAGDFDGPQTTAPARHHWAKISNIWVDSAMVLVLDGNSMK